AFHWILNPYGVMEPAKATAQEKLATLGADSPIVLLAIALFYSIFHSGLEELYWRGFVFRGLREYIAVNPAIVLSSLGFMSHHVIVLAKFFGYDSVVTYLFSLGVAMGGAIWAYTYHRAQSLVPGWISHAFVDAAIFGIGYLMIFAR
ncbi:MAG: CPBP family intramembrane glutamic endopeptidase, partial [Pirellula sp.]